MTSLLALAGGREHTLGANYQARTCQGPGRAVRHDGSAEEGAGAAGGVQPGTI